jgi:hypothetical protein
MGSFLEDRWGYSLTLTYNELFVFTALEIIEIITLEITVLC